MNDTLSFAIGLIGGAGLVSLFVKNLIKISIESAFKKALQDSEMAGRSDLEFRKQQLAELYGPMYAYLKLNEDLFKIWFEGKIPEIDDEIKSLFKYQNNEIVTLLSTKAHLIDGIDFPPGFTKLMTSVKLWNFYTTKMGAFPDRLKELEQARFPQEFQQYVYEKTKEIKGKIEELHTKYRIH